MRNSVGFSYIDLWLTKSSQSSDEFRTLLTNFELLLGNIANRNLFVSIIIDDFNAKSKRIGVLVIRQLMKVKNLNP